ncbi:MAG: glycoside hydrolase family 99-like domain-containing protein [Phycisphaerae bacterium]|nr:glycoside hydrolase family 99-like domain-containing protein [Phycisphaerae bacterium]
MRRRDFLKSIGACAVSLNMPACAMTNKPKTTRPVVGTYYYPWYRSADSMASARKSSWNNTLRLRLENPQVPRSGFYSSRDPKVISDHIQYSLRGGIDFWAVSWWGPGSATDITFKDHILQHKEALKLKYAILYESTGRLKSMTDPNYKNWLTDFEYLKKTYFSDPNYYKIDGRPVVFVYLTRVYFRNKGQDVLEEMRKQFPDVYLVGDDVFGGNYQGKWSKPFDAITAYDVYGQSTKGLGNTANAISHLAKNYRHARTQANAVGTAFIPTIAPGYNDTAVRKGHPGRARYFSDNKKSKPGDLFRAMITDVAIPNLDPRCGNVMMITSFNEWYEDSQIEPTSGKAPPCNKDNSATKTAHTGGAWYYDYEYLYLDILAEILKKSQG